MHYAEIVNIPVSILTGLSVEEFSDLFNACMVQIIQLEAREKEESDFVKKCQLSMRIYNLYIVFSALRHHKHYKAYNARIAGNNIELQQAA
jgi:hypothetical protein